MRLLVVGHGRMGRLVESLAAEYSVEVAGVVHGPSGAAQIAEGDFGAVDVAVDFTLPDAVPQTLPQLAARGINVVIGTTGWQAHEAALRKVAGEAGIGVLAASNFSLGMNLFQLVVEDAARLFAPQADFGAWIHERHHDKKKDAPSGTALHTARQIAAAARAPLNAGRPAGEELAEGCRGGAVDGIPIHSIRLPGLLAHQEVLFGAPGQILTLRHDTLDRQAFMPGVLLGIRRIRERTGLIDSLEHFLSE